MSEENKLDASSIVYKKFQPDQELDPLIKMIEQELSEPYSVFTYRYFIQNWPNLCILAYSGEDLIGCILGKLDKHKETMRGYIAMLVVKKELRKLKIGSKLVNLFIEEVREQKGDEVVLETECVNTPALRLYESFGFARDKRLLNYYMNGNDAFRLKLWLRPKPERILH
eukprot:TRINITY_DN3971_c0_g2_i1.p1 TRINITY_DN3971_c0_g2~~TRINITY_DN3971_c0_g2_i1.p1  ORF type:complete len:169 (-),score=19.49 TRINITY_DN3971_c0_g2_i1:100-606(-)